MAGHYVSKDAAVSGLVHDTLKFFDIFFKKNVLSEF